MVDALNRLDPTDALVEQILGDRAKLEHHANRGHAQSNSHAQAYPMEAEAITSTESKHYHNHEAASDTESDQLDWDPEKLMMTAIPWWTNGSTPEPIPLEGPLDEDEAGRVAKSARRSTPRPSRRFAKRTIEQYVFTFLGTIALCLHTSWKTVPSLCPQLPSRLSSRCFQSHWPGTAPFRSCLLLPPGNP